MNMKPRGKVGADSIRPFFFVSKNAASAFPTKTKRFLLFPVLWFRALLPKISLKTEKFPLSSPKMKKYVVLPHFLVDSRTLHCIFQKNVVK